jgi:hypothetical protein
MSLMPFIRELFRLVILSWYQGRRGAKVGKNLRFNFIAQVLEPITWVLE